jgi:two-component system nitrogen regulation sensor histidine kinase NtrY
LLAFLNKYRAYFLPVLLGILLVVAISKTPQDDLTTSANKIENLITDSENEFDKIAKADLATQEDLLAGTRLKIFVLNRNDSLLLYNDNTVAPSPELPSTLPATPAAQKSDTPITKSGIKKAATPETTVSKLKNGWYLQMARHVANGDKVLGFLLIKHEYRFENKFLKNEYDVGFKIPANYNISEVKIPGSVAVHSRDGRVLFSLYADDTHVDTTANIALVSVYFLILIIIGFYLNELALMIVKKKGAHLGLSFLLVTVAGIRYLMSVYKVPAEFYKMDLFNPSLYGSVLFAGSLGDLLLTCVMLFWFSGFYFSLDERFGLSLFPARYKKTEQAFLICLQFVGSGAILWLFKSLVMDSVISFEVYNVLSLTAYSLLGLLCLTIIIICHFLFSINAFRRLIDLDVSLTFLILGTIVAGDFFVWYLYDIHFAESIIFTAIWSLFFSVTGYLIFKYSIDLQTTRNGLMFILLYSIISMFLIENLYEHKERNKREFLAGKLLAGHDYIAEFTYDDIAERISTDKIVRNFFAHRPASSRELRDRINSLYFSGYFSKYDIKVFAYDSFRTPLFHKDTVPYAHFKDILDTSAAIPDLVYINDSLTNSTYIGIIPVLSNTTQIGDLVLYLTPKIYNGQSVYPELLLGQNIISTIDNSAYNFAIYHNERLVVQHGDFPYTYYWDHSMNTPINQPRFIETNQWEHLACRYPNKRSIVISIPQEGFFEPVATMSYFFVMYLIIITLILSFRNFYRSLQTNSNLTESINISFRARINYTMLFIIIVSFVVIGLLTISFFKSQYDTFYTDRLIRKEKAILANIEYFIQENDDTQQSDSTSYKSNLGDILGIELVKISDIQNIDINIYDVQGELATSSQQSIFDNGLISKRMDPRAFNELNVEHETQYTQQENIGKLSYTASYAPIRDKVGNTVAYLDVPYFEKSKTIDDEVSSFLVTLMNAYVFLLICAAALAYFISNSITRPLRFISEKLRILNLNKKNEPIEWKSKDEVGTLIAEYNKMISELEHSAAKLAKSERESAWREMARQIAHEIKNPLTPMKLSIQYLQRSIDDGKDVTELAKKVNNTLIEQIDNLSAIATAFSTFAQMPRSQNEVIDLNEVLTGIAALFEKEDNVHIHLTTYDDEALVFVDKNQMISVFNNLIKNAIQSVEEGKEAEISIVIKEKEGNIKVVVTDNGSGITPERYDKVFVPNFTTKTSGTGLGLAICKQIIESAKGDIWFESEVGQGTSFYVSLPHYKED